MPEVVALCDQVTVLIMTVPLMEADAHQVATTVAQLVDAPTLHLLEGTAEVAATHHQAVAAAVTLHRQVAAAATPHQLAVLEVAVDTLVVVEAAADSQAAATVVAVVAAAVAATAAVAVTADVDNFSLERTYRI
jgi:hypothetical protein